MAATGRFRSIYAPADFAPVVADWSARWAEAKLVTPWGSAYAEERHLMEQNPSSSGKLVRHDSHDRRVECGRVAWATGVEITRGADQWHVFNVVKVAEDDSNGWPGCPQDTLGMVPSAINTVVDPIRTVLIEHVRT